MKSKYLILLCLYTLLACGQTKEKQLQSEAEVPTKNEDTATIMTTNTTTELDLLQVSIENITADNLVETIANQVQRYKKEPIYYLRIGKANCLIEVLVNDVPTYKNYSLDNLATPLEINHKILKSGTQTVTVRMYPVGDLIKEEYDYGETVTILSDASAVHITVLHADHKGNEGIDDEETVITHNSPTKDETGEVFAGSGLPFFEYIFTFEAIVPYHIENSWDTAVDLTKLDQKDVEQQAVTYYNNFLSQIKNGNIDAHARSNYYNMLTQAQTYYKTQAEIQEVWDDELAVLENPTRELDLFDSKYKVLECASGGGVYLRYKAPEDPQLLHKSMAWVFYKDSKDADNGWVEYYNIYLYCSKKAFRKKKLVFQMM